MHDESVIACLRGGLELQFERLHVKRRTARVFENRFGEGGDGEGRDSDAVLLDLGEEQVPAGRVVAGEVRRVCKRRLDGFFFRCRGGFGSVQLFAFAVLGGFATEDSVEVSFLGINVFEVEFVDLRDVGCSGRYNSSFDDELDETASGDVFLAHDFEEDLFDFQVGNLSSYCHGIIVLLWRKHTGLVGNKFPPLVFWHLHKLLDSQMVFGIGAFDCLGYRGGHVG